MPRLSTCSIVVSLLALAVLGPSTAAGAEHRLGLGLHYWKSVKDLPKEGFPDVDDSGVAWVGSYIFDVEGPLKFGLDLEYFGDGFGGSTSSAWAPQAFLLFGSGLYGGIGVGITLASSFDSNHSDPYFLARVGIDFPIFPRLTLDLNLNWDADAFNQLDNFDSDALTLAAIVRYRIKSRE